MEDAAITEPKHVASDSAEYEAQGAEPKKGRFARMKRWQKILLIVGICLVALILVAVIAVAVMLYVGKSELLDPGDDDQPYQIIEYGGETYAYNENMTSICVIGTDRIYGYVDAESSGHADAILVLAYDTESGKATMINIPRNLKASFMVDTPNVGPVEHHTFLATAYGMYRDNDADSSEQLCDAVSGVLNGIPINNYCTLLESAIAPLTEAMGGVTLTAIEAVPWVGVAKGETYTMQGEQALRYVQWRDINVLTSPIDRMMRQQQFANAFIDQSIAAIKEDPAVLMEFYRIITDPDYMTTNLDLPELAYLVSVILQQGFDQLSLTQVPCDDVYNPELGMSEDFVREDDLTQLLLDIYYKPVEN